MVRLFLAVAAALLAAPAPAAGPAGAWKFRFNDGPEPVTMLLAFTETGGKWAGEFAGSSTPFVHAPQFTTVAVAGDALRFALAFDGKDFIRFDGVAAKDGKKIVGSFSQFGGPLQLTEMYPSKLKKLEGTFDLARENLTQLEPGKDLFDAGVTVAEQAGEKKLPAADVQAMADKLGKAAAGYGTRWEQLTALKLANALAGQKGYEPIVLAQARKAEGLMTGDAPAAARLGAAETLARVLTAAGKPDDAKRFTAAAVKLEDEDQAEFLKGMLRFPVEKAAARKGKGGRTVLVEVFTGSECGPCAAVDIAAEAVLKAYPPSDAIVLEYHFHVPVPDALTSPDGMDRVAYYKDHASKAPVVLLNGAAGPAGGGPADLAQSKFDELKAAIEPLREKPAGARIALTVAKAEKGYTATAKVTDLEAPGDKVALRFVLVEDRVRFAGGNGIRYHSRVVRAMPGGANGFPLTEKESERAVAFDPADVRDKLAAYLKEFAEDGNEFPRDDRPLRLTGLKLVALVQDDVTGEVLQAVQADVDGK